MEGISQMISISMDLVPKISHLEFDLFLLLFFTNNPMDMILKYEKSKYERKYNISFRCIDLCKAMVIFL